MAEKSILRRSPSDDRRGSRLNSGNSPMMNGSGPLSGRSSTGGSPSVTIGSVQNARGRQQVRYASKSSDRSSDRSSIVSDAEFFDCRTSPTPYARASPQAPSPHAFSAHAYTSPQTPPYQKHPAANTNSSTGASVVPNPYAARNRTVQQRAAKQLRGGVPRVQFEVVSNEVADKSSGEVGAAGVSVVDTNGAPPPRSVDFHAADDPAAEGDSLVPAFREDRSGPSTGRSTGRLQSFPSAPLRSPDRDRRASSFNANNTAGNSAGGAGVNMSTGPRSIRVHDQAPPKQMAARSASTGSSNASGGGSSSEVRKQLRVGGRMDTFGLDSDIGLALRSVSGTTASSESSNHATSDIPPAAAGASTDPRCRKSGKIPKSSVVAGGVSVPDGLGRKGSSKKSVSFQPQTDFSPSLNATTSSLSSTSTGLNSSSASGASSSHALRMAPRSKSMNDESSRAAPGAAMGGGGAAGSQRLHAARKSGKISKGHTLGSGGLVASSILAPRSKSMNEDSSTAKSSFGAGGTDMGIRRSRRSGKLVKRGSSSGSQPTAATTTAAQQTDDSSSGIVRPPQAQTAPPALTKPPQVPTAMSSVKRSTAAPRAKSMNEESSLRSSGTVGMGGKRGDESAPGVKLNTSKSAKSVKINVVPQEQQQPPPARPQTRTPVNQKHADSAALQATQQQQQQPVLAKRSLSSNMTAKRRKSASNMSAAAESVTAAMSTAPQNGRTMKRGESVGRGKTALRVGAEEVKPGGLTRRGQSSSAVYGLNPKGSSQTAAPAEPVLKRREASTSMGSLATSARATSSATAAESASSVLRKPSSGRARSFAAPSSDVGGTSKGSKTGMSGKKTSFTSVPAGVGASSSASASGGNAESGVSGSKRRVIKSTLRGLSFNARSNSAPRKSETKLEVPQAKEGDMDGTQLEGQRAFNMSKITTESTSATSDSPQAQGMPLETAAGAKSNDRAGVERKASSGMATQRDGNDAAQRKNSSQASGARAGGGGGGGLFGVLRRLRGRA